MRPFKFFQKGTINDPQMLNEDTYSSASFNVDTPEGVGGENQWGEVERIGEEQYRIRLANVTRVTTVNPKWWMKIKIFIQEAFWFKDPTATIAIAGGLTIGVILIVSKILNIW